MAISQRDPADLLLAQEGVTEPRSTGERRSEGPLVGGRSGVSRTHHAARLRQLVLVVETNGTIGSLLRAGLESSGLDMQLAKDGTDARRGTGEGAVDAVLSNADHQDLGVPPRRPPEGDEVPILWYRARKGVNGWRFLVEPSVTATEPLSVSVFCQHVRARLKPEPLALGAGELQVGAVRIDTSGYRVFVEGEEVVLTALEFRLLVALLRATGHVLSREDLLRQVWGIRRSVDTRTVDTHVKRLRRKLRSEGALIETARGFGYRLVPPAQD